MNQMLDLKIVSPEKVVFDGNASSVVVPGTAGCFEILNGHAPIISSLEKGSVEFDASDGKHKIEIKGGFVEVKQNQILLCVEV